MSLRRNVDFYLLNVLICIVEEGSFTAAADRLDITQQAISAQVKRLETLATRQLLKRTAHGIALTVDGEAMLTYAREIAIISESMLNQFAVSPLAGKVRVGLSPGFPFCVLAAVLGHVRDLDADVEVSIETGTTAKLINKFNAARLDVVFGAQRPGDAKGEALFRDAVEWIGSSTAVLDPSTPVPLVAFPAPAMIRDVMLDSLSRANRTWRIAVESEDLNTIRTSIASGWGITAMNGRLLRNIPEDFALLHGQGLPDLGELEFFLRYDDRYGPSIKTFVDAVRLVTNGEVVPHQEPRMKLMEIMLQ
jgi:DNA-binding transcriptional LysR family regulator